MDRAYALLEIKAIDDDERVIEGFATTPTPDRLGDVVEPDGAEFKLPLPLLWQHNSDEPIGHVTQAKVTSKGIEVKARIARVEEPGILKDRLDEAWQSLKHRLVGGLSIGFKGLETARIEDTFALRFIRWMWLELSVVTIPANAEANIQTIKSIDTDVIKSIETELLAAPGHQQGSGQPSGVTDKPTRVVRLNDDKDRAPFVIRSIKRT